MATLLKRRSLRYWTALALFASILSGCLRGNVHDLIGYDAKHDSFRCLQLFTHIAGHDAAELQHLATQLKRKSEIIVYPLPVRIFDNAPALVRIGNHEYQSISLGDPPKDDPAINRSTIDLSRIEIVPGELFVSKDDTLCYFQEVRIPGAVVDEVLVTIKQELSQALVQKITSELARRTGGGKLGSWDALRRKVLQELTRANAEPPAEETQRDADAAEPGDPVACLEESSLNLLRKTAADPGLALQRTGSTFQISLPLSPEDCRQAKASLEALFTAGIALCEKEPECDPSVIQAFRGATVEVVNQQALMIKISLGNYFCLTTLAGLQKGANLANGAQYRATIEAMQERGLAIRNDLSIEEVVKQFSKSLP